MDERQRLKRETVGYLSSSINGSYYLENIEDPRVLTELTQRVLNARCWKHELDSFEDVKLVVLEAVQHKRL